MKRISLKSDNVVDLRRFDSQACLTEAGKVDFPICLFHFRCQMKDDLFIGRFVALREARRRLFRCSLSLELNGAKLSNEGMYMRSSLLAGRSSVRIAVALRFRSSDRWNSYKLRPETRPQIYPRTRLPCGTKSGVTRRPYKAPRSNHDSRARSKNEICIYTAGQELDK